MKIKREKINKAGNREVTVELDPGESLRAIVAGAYYRLHDPVDEVMASHVLAESTRVFWCSTTQQWVD